MADSVISVANAVAHTFSQVVIAVPLGTVSDWAFARAFDYVSSDARNDNDSVSGGKQQITSTQQFVLQGIEVAAQAVGTGILVAAFLSYIVTLAPEVADPASGSVFIILLFITQRKWRARIDRIIDYMNYTWLTAESGVEAMLKNWEQGANSIAPGGATSMMAQTTAQRNTGLTTTQF